MKFVTPLWRKVTQSKALGDAGPLEKAFFETVYRFAFITGLSTSDNDLGYTLYIGAVLVMSTSIFSMEVWHVTSDNLTMDEVISSINVIIIHFLTFWKLVAMMRNKDVYKKLAKAMDTSYFDIATAKRKQIVEFWVETHRKYLKVLLILANSTLAIWFIFPLIDEVEYNLMIDLRVPIDYHTGFRYAVTYITIGVMFESISCLVIMSEVIMQAHLLPLICQYAVLADCFENVFQDCAVDFQDSKISSPTNYLENAVCAPTNLNSGEAIRMCFGKHCGATAISNYCNKNVNHFQLTTDKLFIEKYIKRLGNLVEQHQLILKQTTDLKTILSAPMLGQLVGSGMLICFVGYQATATLADNVGKFIMSLLYLAYNMFTLYLLCRWCEEITLQSYKIGKKAYFSGWESGMSRVPGVKATIMLVIARANKPLVFFAGGMYTLSLSSYTYLVKASYSALNILLQSKESRVHK